MIRGLINLIKIKEGETVLDPMMGSGTVPIEAAIMGLNSIGVDVSPFCGFMAEAKYDGLVIDVDEVQQQIVTVDKLFNDLEKHGHAIARCYIEGKDKSYVISPQADRFLSLCFYDAMGYAKRVKSKNHRELFEELLDKYLGVAAKFKKVRTSLDMKLGKADIRVGDSRSLDIDDKSIGGCIFSPPYSFAVDYAENDRSQLELMGLDVDALREEMVGLRGGKKAERVEIYFDDMRETMEEIRRVLKAKRYCVIVVGSNTSQLKTILKTDDPEKVSIENRLISIGKNVGLKFVDKITRQITGIRNVMRDEYLLFFQKA